MTTKNTYMIKYLTFHKKDGHKVGGNTVPIQADSETNAIAELKRRNSSLTIEIVSVTPK